ncbi:Membrane protein OS=Streptomyces antimycoticus OX=68175 GN=SANT12839_087390 PE=4 SV=1 [Streptomyces antimycoticus]
MFAAGANNVIVLLVSGLVYGAVFGAIFGFVGHTMTRGQRDFSSRSQIVAARYDVVADAEVADEAKNMLARLAMQEG